MLSKAEPYLRPDTALIPSKDVDASPYDTLSYLTAWAFLGRYGRWKPIAIDPRFPMSTPADRQKNLLFYAFMITCVVGMLITAAAFVQLQLQH